MATHFPKNKDCNWGFLEASRWLNWSQKPLIPIRIGQVSIIFLKPMNTTFSKVSYQKTLNRWIRDWWDRNGFSLYSLYIIGGKTNNILSTINPCFDYFKQVIPVFTLDSIKLSQMLTCCYLQWRSFHFQKVYSDLHFSCFMQKFQ